jgi:hypothetical protein
MMSRRDQLVSRWSVVVMGLSRLPSAALLEHREQHAADEVVEGLIWHLGICCREQGTVL